jgi:SAM-dependent methyltransferase
MPLAGGFLTSDQVAGERKYPLVLYYCKTCSLVQVLDVVDADTLFKNYFYLSSVTKTLSSHFAQYAGDVHERFLTEKNALAVEFGCNDGVLLMPLKELGVRTVGVEPSKNVSEIARAKGLDIINDYFTPKVAGEIAQKHGHADAILANNVFAHIDDLDAVLMGVTDLLKPDGVFVFEVHYLPNLLDGLQYDFFYHEHLCYYSLHSLSVLLGRFGLAIFDATPMAIHSGSIRVMACRKESARPDEPAVKQLMALEESKGLDKLETYTEFADRVAAHRTELRTLLQSFKSKGKRIAGYGASGRANTLLNYCQIGTETIDYIVDDSPLRQGHLTPGTHIPVKPASELSSNPPDAILVLAWSYLAEIMARQKDFAKAGGTFLVPFPEPGVVK